MINPISPGMDWGSRYLIPMMPWLLLLSLHALESDYYNAARQWRWVVAGGGLTLLLVSFYAQYQGAQVVHGQVAANQQLIQEVRIRTSPVLVTDCFWVGPQLEAAFAPDGAGAARSVPRRVVLLISDHPGDRKALTRALEHLRAREFSFTGTAAGLMTLTAMGRSGRLRFAPVETAEGTLLRLVKFQIRRSQIGGINAAHVFTDPRPLE